MCHSTLKTMICILQLSHKDDMYRDCSLSKVRRVITTLYKLYHCNTIYNLYFYLFYIIYKLYQKENIRKLDTMSNIATWTYRCLKIHSRDKSIHFPHLELPK